MQIEAWALRPSAAWWSRLEQAHKSQLCTSPPSPTSCDVTVGAFTPQELANPAQQG